MLTLRTLDRTPPQVRDAVLAFWADVGALLRDQLLGSMAESLGLSPDALTDFVGPGAELGAEKTATMVRLFRYEGCNTAVGEARVVAERTLLMCVVLLSTISTLNILSLHLIQPILLFELKFPPFFFLFFSTSPHHT